MFDLPLAFFAELYYMNQINVVYNYSINNEYL
jgi:hypothetical protein